MNGAEPLLRLDGVFAGYGKIDPEIAWLKLGSLVQGAERASKYLWSA